MDNSNIILRLKKTIVYTEKVLENFPKSEFTLKARISNSLYDILKGCYLAYIDLDNRKKLINEILANMKMVDFYIKMSFDKKIISHKVLKNLCMNLRDITNLLYAWNYKYEKVS